MKADIISIGTEIIMGELVDTNAQYLASRLPGLGIELLQVHQVKDSIESLVSTLQQSSSTSSLILTTGGLGPTDDDLTREAIGEFIGEVSYIDKHSLSSLQQTFRDRGWEMPSLNAKQASLIPSASTVKNTVGTAPGWWVEKDNLILIAMPGPPHEMRQMWINQLEPSLTGLSNDNLTFTRSLKTTGIGESHINNAIAHLFHLEDAQLGIYANTQGIDIRIRVKAETAQEANRIISPIEHYIHQSLGRYIWGKDDQSLEELLGTELMKMGHTIAVMESCTGGLLSNTITSVSGSSGYFIGGIVAYSNDLKIKYGVNSDTINRFGAISTEVAQEMAHAVRASMNTDIGVGITGVAGPDTLEGKPVGTIHMAIEHQEFADAFTHIYNGSRNHIQHRSVVQVISKLMQHIKDL